MVVELFDSDTGTNVYLNPQVVMTMRPDPEDPLHTTVLKLNDGETLRVRGDHDEVAAKLSSPVQ
jgi:uncharacterized protein YlzI (FlbEa/FlbD family)